MAYSHVDFSGNQYILEKGFYNNSADWGSEDNVICSIQPILPVSTAAAWIRPADTVAWLRNTPLPGYGIHRCLFKDFTVAWLRNTPLPGYG